MHSKCLMCESNSIVFSVRDFCYLIFCDLIFFLHSPYKSLCFRDSALPLLLVNKHTYSLPCLKNVHFIAKIPSFLEKYTGKCALYCSKYALLLIKIRPLTKCPTLPWNLILTSLYTNLNKNLHSNSPPCRPTLGERDSKTLLKSIKHMNQDRVTIHTIGFGSLVDDKFLSKLAVQNGGKTERVFENINAATQVYSTAKLIGLSKRDGLWPGSLITEVKPGWVGPKMLLLITEFDWSPLLSFLHLFHALRKMNYQYQK